MDCSSPLKKKFSHTVFSYTPWSEFYSFFLPFSVSFALSSFCQITVIILQDSIPRFFSYSLFVDSLICTTVSINIYFLVIHKYLFPVQTSLTSTSEFPTTYSVLLRYFQDTSDSSCSKPFSGTPSLFLKPGFLLPLPTSICHYHSLKCLPPAH